MQGSEKQVSANQFVVLNDTGLDKTGVSQSVSCGLVIQPFLKQWIELLKKM